MNTASSTPPLTRRRKRAAEAEEKKGQEELENRKRQRMMFQPRKIQGAGSSGIVTLVGPNDMIQNSKNPQKIKIEEKVDEKPAIDKTPTDEEMSTEEQVEFVVKEELHLPLEPQVFKIEEEIEGKVQVVCTRCPHLQKSIDKKDLKIRELEQQLESDKQTIQELSKKLAESQSHRPAEVQLETGVGFNNFNQPENLIGTKTDKENQIYLAIISGKPLEQIEHLVESGISWNILFTRNESILHVAVKSSHLQAVKYFISIGADINAKNSYELTPFLEAATIEENFLEIVEELVKNGANLNEKHNHYGYTFLFTAISKGRSAAEIEKLVSFGANWDYMDTKDNYGNTVLHVAAATGNLEALKYFMSLKRDVHIRNKDGDTPVMKAADTKKNFLPIVQYLLENGADINTTNRIGHALLHLAIMNHQPVSDLEKLVDLGALWKMNRVLRRTGILSFCVKQNYPEALKYFIGKGADVNRHDWENGKTPMTTALRLACHQSMAILTENGAKFEKVIVGQTATHKFLKMPKTMENIKLLFKLGIPKDHDTLQKKFCYCAKEGYLEAVRYYLSKGADVKAVSPFRVGTPMIHELVNEKAQLEVIELLIDMGADINAVDDKGFNLLHVACSQSSEYIGQPLEVVKKLISFGATWTNGLVGTGAKKETILHAAVRGERPEVVKYFISKGVNVNAKDSNGFTPLLLALTNSRPGNDIFAILRVLVNAGADPNAVDNEGNNAFLLAVDSQSANQNSRYYDDEEEVFQVLVALGCDKRTPNKEGVTFLQVENKRRLCSARMF